MKHVLTEKITRVSIDTDTLEKYLFQDKRTKNQRDALNLFCKILKDNRFKVLGNCEPYKVITNGYGQLKWIEQKEGRLKHNARNIFGIMQHMEGII